MTQEFSLRIDPCSDSEKEPFLEFSGKKFRLKPTESRPPKSYEAPPNFPNCCPFHTNSFEEAQRWFKEFPNCCERHTEMVRTWRIEKNDYEGLPRKILDCLSYTEHHIQNQIQHSNWYEDITNYIFYNWWSFGHPNIGGGRYLIYLRNYLEVSADKIPEAKRVLLIEYINKHDTPTAVKSQPDLNILWGTYHRWLKTFPFQLPYFKDLHERLKNTVPVFKGIPKYNPYTEMSSGQVFTQTELVDFLEATTKRLIIDVQTADFEISDKQKHRLQLSEESLRVGTAELVGSFSKGELRYVAILKKWLELQKMYFKEVSEIMGNNATTSPNTKATTHQKTLALCCFYREAKGEMPEMEGKTRKEIEAHFAGQHGLSSEKFRQVSSAMKDKAKRLKKENIPHMESALSMLDGYPKAKNMLEDELKTLKNRQ